MREEQRQNHCIKSFRIDVTVWLDNITRFKYGKWLKRTFIEKKTWLTEANISTAWRHIEWWQNRGHPRTPLLPWNLCQKNTTINRTMTRPIEKPNRAMSIYRMKWIACSSHSRLNAVVTQLNIFTSLKWNVLNADNNHFDKSFAVAIHINTHTHSNSHKYTNFQHHIQTPWQCYTKHHQLNKL